MKDRDWEGSFLSMRGISDVYRDHEKGFHTEISLLSCEGSEEVGTATAEALRMCILGLTRVLGVLLFSIALSCVEEYREAITVAMERYSTLKDVQSSG